MNLTLYKVSAARFDYEYLGKTVPELAQQYALHSDSLQAEIEEEGWERKIEPTVLPQATNIQEFANALESITRSKLSVISLYRQIENQPLIAQLERAFLEKALELAASLNPSDDRASTKLNNLVKSVMALQERNPVDLAEQFKEAINGQAKVVVNIANQLN